MIELPCMDCGAPTWVAEDAGELACKECGAEYSFRLCSACGGIDQVVGGSRGGAWTCAYCRTANNIPMVGKWPHATASQLREELTSRGIDGAHGVKLLGGFVVLGGHGLGLVPGETCSLLTRRDALRITVEIGTSEKVSDIPYGELTELELGGGKRTSGGRFIGGGFGVQGALEGMAIASALNQLTTKTAVDTRLHVGSRRGEALLHHGAFTPDLIRRLLSPMWTRYEAACHDPATAGADDDHVELLRRLGDLHRAGVLTDDEFAAKKADILNRI